MRELIDVFLDVTTADEPTHPATVEALLTAGLVSLLLSCFHAANPQEWSFDALRRVTFVSEVACDLVGLAGFAQLLGFAKRDTSLDPRVLPILGHISHCDSVNTHICAEVGLPTLRRLFLCCERCP